MVSGFLGALQLPLYASSQLAKKSQIGLELESFLTSFYAVSITEGYPSLSQVS